MDNFNRFLTEIRKQLPLQESFDIQERKISIGGKAASMFFTSGLVDAETMQLVTSDLLNTGEFKVASATDSEEFVQLVVPFLSAKTEPDIDTAIRQVYSGLIALVVDGYDKIFMIEARAYPSRGVEEPGKEKSLRGAKDGFTETLMTNIGLIRRRLRNNELIMKAFVLGNESKTDVCMVYMKGKADQKIVDKLGKQLQQVKLDSTTAGEQTVVEALTKLDDKKKRRRQGWINPLPKVRYTQRPDIVSAHVEEGKIAVIVDNSPTVLLLPVGLFDFTQEVDDYYFPVLTGNYFRILRILNAISVLLLPPIYLLISEGDLPAPIDIDFFVAKKDFAISIFWQFILLEVAIDALKLASLNTPDSLGMSLSVIGGLVLGDFSISAGWFIPQTILCMAIVALASYTQPSIELGYGVKFARILILIGIQVFSIWGALIALALCILVAGMTKTVSGTSYLYPIIPFDKTAAKHIFFRSKLF